MITVDRTISITEGRKNLFEIARKVQTPGVAFTLTENGKPAVAIMSAHEYESWAETLGVVSDMPNIHDDVVQARRDFEDGNTTTLLQFQRDIG